MKTYGFIGLGNMGKALASAILKKESPKNILISNRTKEKALKFAESTHCICSDNRGIADQADYIFLSVKPQILPEVLKDISPILMKRKTGFTLITMAPGITIEKLRNLAGGDYPVIRIMPNTPVSIGQGMTQYASQGVSQKDLDILLSTLSDAGRFDELPEYLIDAACSISGCGPAFAYMVIDALADGGVSVGLPRDKAIQYAAQTLIGAAKMVIETEQHPDALKDAVCSPGGSTIEGVAALENNGMRAAFINAVKAAYKKV